MELLIENTLNIGEDEFYRASRYNLALAVMLVNSQDKKAFDILENSIRKTDVIQQLNSDTIVVFLTHTNYDESMKFIKKLESKFEFTYTCSEFQGSREKFLKTLFLENEEKCMAI